MHRDDGLRLLDGERGNMYDTYLVLGDKLGLRFKPEQLLIAPDPGPVMP